MSNLTSKRFWDWVDQRYIVRRTLLLATVYLTFHAYFWAVDFAASTTKAGGELGLIIAAITTPVSLLMGFISKVYSDGRGS